MSKMEAILVSLSIVIMAPVEERFASEDRLAPGRDALIDAAAEGLRSSLPALEDATWFVEEAGVNFHYLAEENAGLCARCGRWASDADAPGYLDLLRGGRMVAGALVCDECFHFGDDFPLLETSE